MGVSLFLHLFFAYVGCCGRAAQLQYCNVALSLSILQYCNTGMQGRAGNFHTAEEVAKFKMSYNNGVLLKLVN
jgi:hypothetical protein